MNARHSRPRPISGLRHAGAVLGAALVAATVLAIVADLAGDDRDPAAGAMRAMTIWLETYVAVIPIGGLLFSLAFPVTRTARGSGLPISVLVGAVGGMATAWAELASPDGMITVTSGALIGCAYWQFARHHRAEPGARAEQSGPLPHHACGQDQERAERCATRSS